MASKIISQDKLKRVLHYNPETGVFIWLVNRGKCHIGDIAGTVSKDRHVRIGLNYSRFKAHRLAFIYMTGKSPDEIDHINQDPSDNRWCNLRPITHTFNMRNMPKLTTNTSGVTGVVWSESKQKWKAEIWNGKNVHLGLFATIEEAAAARKGAEKILKFHQNHGISPSINALAAAKSAAS